MLSLALGFGGGTALFILFARWKLRSWLEPEWLTHRVLIYSLVMVAIDLGWNVYLWT